jgi:hypothetical protein
MSATATIAVDGRRNGWRIVLGEKEREQVRWIKIMRAILFHLFHPQSIGEKKCEIVTVIVLYGKCHYFYSHSLVKFYSFFQMLKLDFFMRKVFGVILLSLMHIIVYFEFSINRQHKDEDS